MNYQVVRSDRKTICLKITPDGEVGPVCTKLYRRITGIQFGEIEDTHGWCHFVD